MVSREVSRDDRIDSRGPVCTLLLDRLSRDVAGRSSIIVFETKCTLSFYIRHTLSLAVSEVGTPPRFRGSIRKRNYPSRSSSTPLLKRVVSGRGGCVCMYLSTVSYFVVS